MTEWKEAKTGDVIQLSEGEHVEGKFVGMEQSKKFPDSYAVKIDTKDGQKVLFANEILRQKIEDANLMKGQELRILYVGMKKNATGSREYKNFTLFYK